MLNTPLALATREIHPLFRSMLPEAIKPKVYSYVRFSSPEQAKGHSLERQLEAARKWCVENNQVLDESLTYRDLGKSAFKGAHVTEEGALGHFLKAIEEGKVAKGSVLVVESLDRISRQEIDVAHALFTYILKNGVDIVTLSDGNRYFANEQDKSKKFTQMLISIAIFFRANNESSEKSNRVAKAWDNARQKAVSGKILTSRCPEWLYVKDGKFCVYEDRAKLVNWMFDETIKGVGRRTLAQQITVPCWGRGKKVAKRWQYSYIGRILGSRAVLGEYQPYKSVSGNRQEAGPPIVGYYPKIVDIEKFNKVNAPKMMGKKFVGRKSKDYANLFSSLLKCRECDSTIYAKDRGREDDVYLYCSNPNCELSHHGWKLVDFESTFFHYCYRHLDSLFSKSKDYVEAAQEKMLEAKYLETKIKNCLNELTSFDDEGIREQLRKQIKDNTAQLAKVKQEQELANAKATMASTKDTNVWTELFLHRKTLEGRKEIQNWLRTNINNINVSTQKRFFIISFYSGDFEPVVEENEEIIAITDG